MSRSFPYRVNYAVKENVLCTVQPVPPTLYPYGVRSIFVYVSAGRTIQALPDKENQKKIKVFNYLKRDYSPLYKLKGLVRLAARLRFAFYDSLQALK